MNFLHLATKSEKAQIEFLTLFVLFYLIYTLIFILAIMVSFSTAMISTAMSFPMFVFVMAAFDIWIVI